MSEIESRLYDKFNISISEVKVLLADSGKRVTFMWTSFSVLTIDHCLIYQLVFEMAEKSKIFTEDTRAT